MKKALLFGASGLVGSCILQELLADPAYGQVTVVVRKDLGIVHSKLKVLLGDFTTLPNLREHLKGDDVFIALGSTKKKTSDPAQYYQIDHDYPLLAATIAKEQGASSVLLVSAIGANPKSRVFYTRLKGETERDIAALNFSHTHIFRPSIIIGERKEKRPLEAFCLNIFSIISPLLTGKLSQYRSITAKDIARSMVAAAKTSSAPYTLYDWKGMQDLLHGAEK